MDAARLPYRLARAADGGCELPLPCRPGEALRPQDVSAAVLRPLLEAASRRLGAPVRRAVIAVPAYFNDAQRAATAAAGAAAGLERCRLVHEPVAAALAYGAAGDAAADATVLVFDLGGGTFDVALLDVGGGCCEVLASGGDARLGGDDFDAALAATLRRQAGRPPPPAAALQRAARALREALSHRGAVTYSLGGGGRRHSLTRAGLEALLSPLLERMRAPLVQAAWTAGVDLAAAQLDASAAAAAAAAGPRRTR